MEGKRKENGMATYGFQVLENEENPSQIERTPHQKKRVRSIADNVKEKLNASLY